MTQLHILDTPPVPPTPPPALDGPFMRQIHAMDRLNSWVRADSDWSMRPRSWIYSLKNEAIRQAIAQNLASQRRVKVAAECRHCDGHGTWTDWESREPRYTATCRKCSAGRVTLRFVETRIGDVCWHSPSQSSAPELPGLSPVWHETDWQPNTKGKPLTIPEVADLLCDVEEAFPRAQRHHYDRDGNEFRLAQYDLYIGQPERTSCPFDGRPLRATRIGVHSRRLAWSDQVCAECFGVLDLSVFDRLAALGPAPHLIADPRIQRWIATHPSPGVA